MLFALHPLPLTKRPAQARGSVGLIAPHAPAAWVEQLAGAGAKPGDANADHLVVVHPSAEHMLEIAQHRLQQRGSTWLIHKESPEGAICAAIADAAAVEGAQQTRTAAGWYEASAIISWLSTQPHWCQGPAGDGVRLAISPALPHAPVMVRDGAGQLSKALAGGRDGPKAAVLELPDKPVRACTAADLSWQLETFLQADVLLLTADAITARPNSLPSAALGRAAAWQLARTTKAYGFVGPVGAGRTFGIGGIDPHLVRQHAAAARGQLWLDVDWGPALEAFPHMRDRALGIYTPKQQRVSKLARQICSEAERVLGTRVAPNEVLADRGLDSLAGEELRQALVQRYAVPLELTFIYANPTAEAMASRITQTVP